MKDFFSLHSDIDVIVHCASFGGSRSSGYDENHSDVAEKNLRMFFNTVRCLQSRQRLIFMGSGAAYAKTHYRPKMAEEYFDTHAPSDSYGYAKYIISRFIELQDNMIDLRIFGLYGGGEDYRFKFISNAIVKALMGKPISIAQNVVFDYLYIDDFMRIIEKLLFADWPYRQMNVTPTESIDLISLAQLVNGVTGNQAGIKILNSGNNEEYTGNNTKLLNTIGDFSFTSYKKGIAELVQYYRSKWDQLDLDIISADPFLDKCIIKR